MINVILNHEKITLERNQSLVEVLKQFGFTSAYFAVAINQCFVPRAKYTTTLLNEGDVIDIVSPMQGG